MDSLSRFKLFTVLAIVTLAALLIFNPTAAQEGKRKLEIARQQIEANGRYSFTADIEQTLIPRPVPSMIGESSQRVDMRLDGDVTLPNGQTPASAELQLRFEGEGPNAQPLVFEQQGSDTYLLKDGRRIKIDNPTAGALPTADMLTYLAAAENVTPVDEPVESPDEPAELIRYTFDINGTTLAQVIQSQNGTTNGRTNLALSPTLRRTTGSGEIWIDAEGFPRRQIIDLNIPEVTDEYHTTVHIVVDFRYGNGQTPELLPAYSINQSTNQPNQLNQPNQPNQPLNQSTSSSQVSHPLRNSLFTIHYSLFLTFFLLLTAALILGRRHRHLCAGVAISLSLIFLFAPVLQAAGLDHNMAQATASTQTLPQALGIDESSPAEETAATTKTQPLNRTERTQSLSVPTLQRAENRAATTCGQGESLDTDLDGLNDNVKTASEPTPAAPTVTPSSGTLETASPPPAA